MRRIGVLSSGGDTPGMNAAIRSVVKTGAHLSMDVMGIEYGFRGLMQGRIRQLTPCLLYTSCWTLSGSPTPRKRVP